MQEGTLVTEKILATKMQQYLHKGHHLFIDNYYTSMSLVQYFIGNGTIRDNMKNFPTQVREVILNRGGAAYYYHGHTVVKYRGKKDSSRGQPKIIYVLSTEHPAAMGNTTKKDVDIVQKPTSIISYRHNVGGVDLED